MIRTPHTNERNDAFDGKQSKTGADSDTARRVSKCVRISMVLNCILCAVRPLRKKRSVTTHEQLIWGCGFCFHRHVPVGMFPNYEERGMDIQRNCWWIRGVVSRAETETWEKKTTYFDYKILLFIIIFLLCFGLATLYSSSSYTSAFNIGTVHII